jgi:hypothetical protein
MAQNLEFSATSGLTLTATAYAIGAYAGGTNAGSVTQQSGTNRYLAAFATNLTAGAWRLDYKVSGTCIGQEVYDVDGSGTYQPRSELGDIRTQTALIGSANAVFSGGAVASDGNITEIVIGDDYLEANSRHFSWTVNEPSGYVAATSTAWFGGESILDTGTWLVQGTIVDNGATWTLKFDLPKTSTASLLKGLYAWSVEVRSVSNAEATVVKSSNDDDAEPTRLVRKYT